MIVQEFATEGAFFSQLGWSARPRALASAFGHYVRAVRAVQQVGIRGTLIDPKVANFKFAPDGRVVSWFDPAGVGGPLHWISLRSRMLVRKVVSLRAAQAGACSRESVAVDGASTECRGGSTTWGSGSHSP